MFDYAREEVAGWLQRRLDSYYPILYIDATFIPTRRVDSVSKEAYFTILAVKADMTREVLAVVNNPTEGSSFWNDILLDLKARGVKEVGLVVSDGLPGIETVVQSHFRTAEVQLCTVHLQRECQKRAKTIHKAEIADDLKEVFVCDEKDDSASKGLERWGSFLREMEEALSVVRQHPEERTGTVLLHLSGLRLPHQKHDPHDQLDRAAEPGLQKDDTNEGCPAECGCDNTAAGACRHVKAGIPVSGNGIPL